MGCLVLLCYGASSLVIPGDLLWLRHLQIGLSALLADPERIGVRSGKSLCARGLSLFWRG